MAEREKNNPEREFFSPETWIELNIENPENVSLEYLSEDEGEKLIELLEAKVVEVEPGPMKVKYRLLLQKVLRRLSDRKFSGDASRTKPIVQEQYRVLLGNTNLALQAGINETHNYSDTILIDNSINTTTIDYESSHVYLLNISSENHECFINLKFFALTLKDGSIKRYLYIADRYVIPTMRKQGAGEQLLLIAEEVARNNDCSLIFSKLVPEDPSDLESLIANTEKLGYHTNQTGGLVVSTKKIKKL